jgi:PEP-CTERM motif
MKTIDLLLATRVPGRHSLSIGKRHLKVVLVGTLLAVVCSTTPAAAGPILADSTYSWTLGGASNGSGTLTTGNADGAAYDVTDITGTIDGEAITGLVGGQPGHAVSSPSGAFTIDNLIYDSDPSFDNPGILFSLANAAEGNIWGNEPGSYSFYTWNGSYAIEDGNDSFTLGPIVADPPSVPEPISLSIFGFGLIFLYALNRRTHKAGRLVA